MSAVAGHRRKGLRAAAPPPRGIGSRPPVSPTLTEPQREVLDALRAIGEPVPAAALLPLTGLTVTVVRRALADLRTLRLVSADRLRTSGGGNVWSATP